MSVLDKLYLMVTFKSWSFGEYGVHLHCHYSQVHSDRLRVPLRVPSIGQIELFIHLLIIIIIIIIWNHTVNYSYYKTIFDK